MLSGDFPRALGIVYFIILVKTLFVRLQQTKGLRGFYIKRFKRILHWWPQDGILRESLVSVNLSRILERLFYPVITVEAVFVHLFANKQDEVSNG